MDAISLSVFASRIEAVCDEMGAVLKRVAFSPNIKDRLDFSCAIFDDRGELCAQAAHIPVHLGSMAYAAKGIVRNIEWQDGDVVVLNDPYLGGTHLPDITLISPIFIKQQLMGFVANRAHHADIGASSPGSMPISSHLDEEGLVIPPTHLVRNGIPDQQTMNSLLSVLQNPQQSHGDFVAQMSANQRGVDRVSELMTSMGLVEFRAALQALNNYGARIARASIGDIENGSYDFCDVMDDDGQGSSNIKIQLEIRVSDNDIAVDFSGTSPQVAGNINCPLSVAAAAVYYVFRCLMPENTPACAGSFQNIKIEAPEGCLVNANHPAAVAAGNVETSTRIVDVVCGALNKALPGKLPAASHGSMNNLAMGAAATANHGAWDYYETIGGGMGASASQHGLSGVQTHMTNTLNTPVEVLEMNYPVRIAEYALRNNSAGNGEHKGGEGLIRSYEMLNETHITLLTERRSIQPWGINASPASVGENLLNGKKMPAKFTTELLPGDRLTIKSPGGGGYTP